MATVETRLATVEAGINSCRSDLQKLKNDYYDVADRLGIRTKVIVMWYGAWVILLGVGMVFGWVLRGLGG